MHNYYEILGITKEATIDDVKTIHKKLARIYHPDASNSNFTETHMKKINTAFDVLSDPMKRAEYDNELLEESMYEFQQDDNSYSTTQETQQDEYTYAQSSFHQNQEQNYYSSEATFNRVDKEEFFQWLAHSKLKYSLIFAVSTILLVIIALFPFWLDTYVQSGKVFIHSRIGEIVSPYNSVISFIIYTVVLVVLIAVGVFLAFKGFKNAREAAYYNDRYNIRSILLLILNVLLIISCIIILIIPLLFLFLLLLIPGIVIIYIKEKIFG